MCVCVCVVNVCGVFMGMCVNIYIYIYIYIYIFIHTHTSALVTPRTYTDRSQIRTHNPEVSRTVLYFLCQLNVMGTSQYSMPKNGLDLFMITCFYVLRLINISQVGEIYQYEQMPSILSDKNCFSQDSCADQLLAHLVVY